MNFMLSHDLWQLFDHAEIAASKKASKRFRNYPLVRIEHIFIESE
jgi:hypothetical protein